MLTKKEVETIKNCAMKYNVSLVYLFGSSVGGRNANDIDLAIRGIKPQLFFDFYAELFKNLSKSIDLVDLDDVDNYLVERILKEGISVYETRI